jgi:RND superfamily putative drug exporter
MHRRPAQAEHLAHVRREGAGEDELGDNAHDFYNRIVSKLGADTAHVEHVEDFWSDPLTAAGSQSVDGKAAYVQVFLVGAQGTTPSIESVAAVRKIVDDTPHHQA